MKQIRLCFRTTFEQPIGAMNPLGAKISWPITVEIYDSKPGHWVARSPFNKAPFKEIHPAVNPDLAKKTAERMLERLVSDWRTLMANGKEILQPELIISKDDGKYYLMEPSDFTHIQDPAAKPDEPVDKLKAVTACGNVVYQKFFVSVHGSVEPTCTVCREEFQKMKASSSAR